MTYPPIEPSTPEARIVLRPPVRGSHERDWPSVEVTEQVTFIAHESWGTRAATVEVVAERTIDIRDGHTLAAVQEAKRLARHQIAAARAELLAANPDYMTPRRY